MYKLKRNSIWHDEYKYNRINGTAAVICKHCGNVNLFEIMVVTTSHNDNVKIEPQITVMCSTCGGKNKLEPYDIIDPNIADIIATLNGKGYRTTASCDGHEDGVPYISFSKDCELETIPEMWERIDESIYFSDEDMKNEVGLKSAKKWADSLPKQPLSREQVRDIIHEKMRLTKEEGNYNPYAKTVYDNYAYDAILEDIDHIYDRKVDLIKELKPDEKYVLSLYITNNYLVDEICSYINLLL